MRYKTIILELLEQHPETYNRLRKKRTLLPTLECCARQLKTSHEAWKDRLSRVRPGHAPSQVASEAPEMARKDLEDWLHPGLPPDESDPLSLEGVMAFIHGHTPPG